MRQRKELVEAADIRTRVTHLSLSISSRRRSIFGRRSLGGGILRCLLRRRRWWCRRWRWRQFVLGVCMGWLVWFLRALGILRIPRILSCIALGGGGVLVHRRSKRCRASDNVQQLPDVLRGAPFIVILCNQSRLRRLSVQSLRTFYEEFYYRSPTYYLSNKLVTIYLKIRNLFLNRLFYLHSSSS